MATEAAPPANKSSKGRKKIEMKLIKKKTSRMVTFSKRRASLFRKASELATLCNAHLAIMMFSPGGKIYSFGHPNVGAVLERYESSTTYSTQRSTDDHELYLCSTRTDQFMIFKAEKTLRLKMELQRTLDDIQSKREKIKMLDMVWEKEHETRYWWNTPIEEMDMDSCKALEEKLMKLRMEVEAKLKTRNNNQVEHDYSMKKDDIDHQVVARGNYNVVAPNNHSSDVLPNNLVAGWINNCAAAYSAHNYMTRPNINGTASTVSNYMSTNFLISSELYNSEATSTNGATNTNSDHVIDPKNYGVGSYTTNFNNFPF